MRATIAAIIQESIAVKQALAVDESLLAEIAAVAKVCIETCRRGGKLLFCGNGGSAADAQHIAAELSGRFKFDRPPLYAEALHVNTSYLTAVANDYGYDETFARMVRAAGRPGDVLFAISTSGNSANILRAAQDALHIPMTVVALTGVGGGQLAGLAQHLIAVPSADTARIQECHILIGHILCGLIEEGMFT